MKVVQACLSVRKDLESRFHRCGGPVRIVQACLESSFHHCGGHVKIVQACLCARKVLES